MSSSGYGNIDAERFVAGQTIGDGQLGLIAAITSSLTATICTTPNGDIADAPAGIFHYPATSGQVVPVALAGSRALVTVGSSLAAGIFLTCNASARAVAVASGGVAIARLLEAATADGEKRRALVLAPFRFVGT